MDELLLLVEEARLDVDMALADVDMFDSLHTLYTEAGDEEKSNSAGSGFSGAISKVFDRVIKFFQDVMAMVRDIFAKRDNITSEDLKKANKKVSVDGNVVTVQNKIHKAMEEGNGLLSRLTNGIVDSEKIKAWLDNSGALLHNKLNPKDVSDGAADIVAKSVMPNIFRSNKLMKEAEKLAGKQMKWDAQAKKNLTRRFFKKDLDPNDRPTDEEIDAAQRAAEEARSGGRIAKSMTKQVATMLAKLGLESATLSSQSAAWFK